MADMKLKAISAKEAKRINEENGMCHPWGDGITFYATDENEIEGMNTIQRKKETKQ